MSQDTEAPAFKVGDVVQLKSGGIAMTVMEVKSEGEGIVTCIWTEYGQMFDGIRPQAIIRGSFPPQTLKKVRM